MPCDHFLPRGFYFLFLTNISALFVIFYTFFNRDVCCFSETPALPPVQVFDKTMVVKQMHVLEPQDLLITRADKGRLRPQREKGRGRVLSSPSLHDRDCFPWYHPPLFTPSFAAEQYLQHSFFLIIPFPLSYFISVIALSVLLSTYLPFPPLLVQWTHWSLAVI